MPEPILEIENLSISFFTRAGEIPAVMNFSATVEPGQALGLVGELGCGKSTVALGGDARPRQERPHRRRLDPLQGPRPRHHVRRRSCARSAARRSR